MYLSLNKLKSLYGKTAVLIFYIHCIKLEESQSHHFLTCSSFASKATNFFIHSLNRFLLKKNCLRVAGFYQSVALYANTVYPLNTCKLDREENLFDFYVESIAFRIKILINITSI